MIRVNINEYECAVEAILFASGESVELSRLAYCLELDEKSLKSIIERLMDKYSGESRGMKIIQLNDAYQMCTNEIYYDFVSKLVKAPSKKVLTQTLLETLAIVAYKQPITKSGIEDIRGVNAEHAINKLVEYRLIFEVGRMETPGKPILFGTTDEFLKYYGLQSLNDLPEQPEISLEQIMEEFPGGLV